MSEAPPFYIFPEVDIRSADCRRLRLVDHRDPGRPILMDTPSHQGSEPVVMPPAESATPGGIHLNLLLQTQEDWIYYQPREPQPV